MNNRKILQTPEGAAFLGALLSGIAAHAFALVNILHNYDNILQQPKGYGAGITSGRWLLTILGDFCQNVLGMGYNLPVINGLLYLVLIALSAAAVVRLLNIRLQISSVLVGCLMATFPTVAATMVFRYTAPYYGLSLLLSVLAVCFADKKRYGVFVSALCLSLSMGLYQAYPPMTIALFVLILMRDSMKKDAKLQELICRGVRYCAALILGVLLYFLFLKLSLAVYSVNGEVTLDSYQGIDSMGKISLSRLPGLIMKAWFSAALFSVKDYCELAATPVMKILWSLVIAVILLMVACILLRKKIKPLPAMFCCLMGMLFPLAINFIVIMCPDGSIYTIMVYAFVLVGCAALMLLECLPDKQERINCSITRLTGILLALIVFCNSYYINHNYTSLYYANRQVENFVSGITLQARMTEGYTSETKWIFVGDMDKFDLYDMWFEIPYYGGIVGSTGHGLFNATYSRDFWFRSYLGMSPCYASQEEQLVMEQDPRVVEMPCWPDEGSVQMIDEFLIVKFQEIEKAAVS